MSTTGLVTKRRSRGGFAIFMVVMIALILSAFAVIMWSLAGSNEPVREFVMEKKQAEYLAKGAQQHFLLKFRYLPTELYDAVAYSIGKNPYYDFGRPHQPASGNNLNPADAAVNPGPMFYFGTVTMTFDADGIPQVTRAVDLDNPTGTDKDTIRALLKMYLLDVATLYPSNKESDGVVVISSAEHPDQGMTQDGSPEPTAGWRDPFVGNYAVQNATILGLSGGKRYDKDSLLVTTLGSVRRAGQISMVTKGAVGGRRDLSTGRKMISDLTFGVHEFPEATTYLEDLAEYTKKTAGDDVGADGASVSRDDTNVGKLGLTGVAISSGRRTEIATGIYHIQRQN